MHVSVLAMTLLLGFGIWTVAGEPRLKFTDFSSSPDLTASAVPASAVDQSLVTAPGDLVGQN